MRMDVDFYQNPYLPSALAKGLPERAYWTSPTYGFMLTPRRIRKGTFQHLDKLCVLKLSGCMFSLASPPFLCCHNLRFLWIDHCRPLGRTDNVVGKAEDDIRQCFQRLWVLDVRCSNSAFLSAKMIDFMTQLRELNVMEEDWLDMDHFQGRLHNLRRFRVTQSSPVCLTDPEYLFSGMGKLELLEFSGNYSSMSLTTKRPLWLSVGSSCSSLETVIIDRCEYLPRISLTGCVNLKNLFLSGSFPNLHSLDITGSAVKTLDLSAVTAPVLDELILLDCGKLCAILWPPEDKKKRYLGKLRVDTTQKAGGDHGTGRSPPPTAFNWYISVRDARLLGSLAPVKDYFVPHCAHLEISAIPSPTCAPAAAATAIAGSKGDGTKGGSRQKVQVNLQQKALKEHATYTDISATLNALLCQGPVINCCMCPPPPCVPSQGCYMHIEGQMGVGAANSITIPGFICDSAKILHVHDSSSITRILAVPLVSTTWNQLEWCRVERCPNLECVISSRNGAGPGGRSGNDTDMFKKLRTIWASHLLNTRCIWSWSVSVGRWDTAFVGLTLLHLDHCPRLIYATHLAESQGLESLETLQIMWCGDLSMVFKGSANWRLFPNLKHIHLHELPKLQGICDVGCHTDAANLATIKIRGCWNLKSLPNVAGKNVVECDCEKEWWDSLEWDPYVEPSLQYTPTHPRHYKKTMLRGSVLR
ncbi:uncharacterized protein LOC120713637 isoform X1 [Panicum virgatum]|uniref:Disease resistance protein At4g27190-like leucine-rich repeats domain-containing protein n=1 Tax=Panicum virgatum TaxID=38727 RepID=A0A8T0RER5_PANVG|nr:uncharacterized protein LOC120713637 isoform X1 [Panicum virgatum]XP_039855498.1 uncharacterized protein LOC120713637 isoform X2 [Panicum virgatum]XP_039855499.1 uncharacterized protein LOC120713637 isoform X1 [Panicum virgatum]XP_039855501.1 uncharacterized protein LOC120713637 isoform X1 [Panicum virgatum]KAG2583540.1 hypothetical protein PVAP13_6KG261200 [Panicum virgatum]